MSITSCWLMYMSLISEITLLYFIWLIKLCNEEVRNIWQKHNQHPIHDSEYKVKDKSSRYCIHSVNYLSTHYDVTCQEDGKICFNVASTFSFNHSAVVFYRLSPSLLTQYCPPFWWHKCVQTDDIRSVTFHVEPTK